MENSKKKFQFIFCLALALISCDEKNTSVTDPITLGFDKRIGGPYNQFGYAIDRTHDGGFIIVGSTDTPSEGGDSYLYIVKTNANGDTVWTRTYIDEQVDEESFKTIKQTQGNGFIVAFTNYGGGGKIAKLNSDGQIEWIKSYASWYNAAYPTSDGGYIANGVYLTKLNGDGDSIWTKPISGNDVKPMEDGYIICANISSNTFLLTKTDLSGNTVFSTNCGLYAISQDIFGNAVAVTADKGFLIAGRKINRNASGEQGIFIVKTDSIGNSLWAKFFPGGAYDEGAAIVEVPDGYVITGTQGEGSVVLKLDFNGVAMWTYSKSDIFAYGITNIAKTFVISGMSIYGDRDLSLFSLIENQ